MIRQSAPFHAVNRAMQSQHFLDIYAAHINAIQREHRKNRRKCFRRFTVRFFKYFAQSQIAFQRGRYATALAAPVIKIARHHQRCIARCAVCQKLCQLINLHGAALLEQAEMYAHTGERHVPTRYIDTREKMAARFKPMMRDITINPIHYWVCG